MNAREAREPEAIFRRVGRVGPRTRFATKEYLLKRRRVLPDGCWIWVGATNRYRYGKVTSGGRNVSVHRLAADLWDIPGTGPCVLHTCDTPLCFNPEHLRRGTLRDNIEDATRKGRMAKGELWHGYHTAASLAKLSQRKLTPEQAARARAEYAAGTSRRVIATRYGVSGSTITRICRGYTYAD